MRGAMPRTIMSFSMRVRSSPMTTSFDPLPTIGNAQAAFPGGHCATGASAEKQGRSGQADEEREGQAGDAAAGRGARSGSTA